MPQYIHAITQALYDTFYRWDQHEDNWFSVDLKTPKGTIQIAAEIIIDMNSRHVALFDLIIYPENNNFPIGTAATEIREAIRDFKAIVNYNGFSASIIGQRVNNSSSARPGHHIHLNL